MLNPSLIMANSLTVLEFMQRSRVWQFGWHMFTTVKSNSNIAHMLALNRQKEYKHQNGRSSFTYIYHH